MTDSASGVSLLTGHRFSQLLKAEHGLDLVATNNALSMGLSTQPFPSVFTSSVTSCDYQAVEHALKDYAKVQIPPDFAAPAIPEAFLQCDNFQQQFPFSPLTLARDLNATMFNMPQSPGNSRLPASNNFSQQPPFGNTSTFQTPIDLLSITPRHTSTRRSHPITPVDVPPSTSQTNPELHSLPLPTHTLWRPTPIRPPSDAKPITGSADMPDGSWAMELLKGDNSAQNGLSFPSWDGLIGAKSTLPTLPLPQQPDMRKAQSSNLLNAVATLPGKSCDGAAAQVLSSGSSSPASDSLVDRRKRSSTFVSENTPGSSGMEYEYNKTKRGKSTASQPPSTREESTDGREKKPFIACHICRARKLKWVHLCRSLCL